MADNSQAGAAVGIGDVFRTDDLGTSKVPYAKLNGGGDGVDLPIVAGQQTMANSLPVVLPSDQTALPITDNAGSLTVDAPVGTPVFVRLSDGSTGAGFGSGSDTSAQRVSLSNANAVAHDAVVSTNPVTVGGVASAAAPSAVSADGDSVRLWALRNGTLQVGLAAAGALIGGDVTNGLDVDVTRIIPDVTATALGKAEDAPHGSGDTGVAVWAVRNDAGGSSAANGDYVAIVSDSGGRLWTAGQVAHDAAIAGAPFRTAGRAATADYTAVADGDTADFLASILGKQVVLTGAIPALTWSATAAAGGLVTTTAVTLKAAGAAGVRNYIKSIRVVNSHPTISSEVVIRDGAAGTVLDRGWAQAGGGGYSTIFDPPLRGSTATLVEIAEITATATTGIVYTVSGYSGAE